MVGRASCMVELSYIPLVTQYRIYVYSYTGDVKVSKMKSFVGCMSIQLRNFSCETVYMQDAARGVVCCERIHYEIFPPNIPSYKLNNQWNVSPFETFYVYMQYVAVPTYSYPMPSHLSCDIELPTKAENLSI